jgi:hypothetical protein
MHKQTKPQHDANFIEVLFILNSLLIILKNEKSLHINLYSSLYFLKLGITNPTPLNRNLVLEICKKEVIDRLVVM